jgi:CubicO group peptidase (beta-lactamase class C family)
MSAAREAASRLFAPLGISDASWPADPTGNSIGGWGLELSARDLARLGELYLRGGRWGGRQVVPRAWVRASTATQVALGFGGSSFGLPTAPGYGYFWWRYPGRRPPGFAAIGRGGQFVLVWPGLDLVVVTTAEVQDSDWDLGTLLRRFVLPAVRP